MAVHIIKDPVISINSVDLTDRITQVEIKRAVEEMDTTACGADGKDRISGLEDSSITLNFNVDYDAAETDATMSAIFGSAVAVTVQPFSGSVTATNPSYRGTVLALEYNPIMGDVGAVNQTSVTWPYKGAVTRHTS